MLHVGEIPCVAVDTLTIEVNFASIRCKKARDDIKKRAFATSRGTQQGDKLPVLIVVHQGKGGGQGIVKDGQVEEGGGQQDKGDGRPSGGGKAAWQRREHHRAIIPPARGGN